MLVPVSKADLGHFARAGALAERSTLRRSGALGVSRQRRLQANLADRVDRKSTTAISRRVQGLPSSLPKERTLQSSPGSGWGRPFGKALSENQKRRGVGKAAYSEAGTAPRAVQPRTADGKYASHANKLVHVAVNVPSPKTSVLRRYTKDKNSPWGATAGKGKRLS